MSLAESLNRTRSTVEEYQKILALQQERNKYQQAINQLETNHKTLKPLLESYRTLKAYFSDELPRWDDGKKDLEKMADLIELFNKKKQLPESYKLTQIHNSCVEFEQEVRTTWQTTVNGNTLEVIRALSVLNPLLESADQKLVSELNAKVEQLKVAWPVKNSHILSLEKVVGDGKEIINKLDAGDEVQEFLKKVASNKASVADITPDIQAWLRSQKLEQRLRITFMQMG